MRSLLIATSNPGKAREFGEMLGADWKIMTLLDLPGAEEVVEDGHSFEANARKKALVFSGSGEGQIEGWVLADDSGLEVDILDGAPGIYSARYAAAADGTRDDEANNRKLLSALEGFPDGKRGAQFRCVLALARAGEVKAVFEGVIRGRILKAPRGANGFGYDPLFQPDGYDRTTAELSPEEKHRISHRGMATRQAADFLQSNADQ